MPRVSRKKTPRLLLVDQINWLEQVFQSLIRDSKHHRINPKPSFPVHLLKGCLIGGHRFATPWLRQPYIKRNRCFGCYLNMARHTKESVDMCLFSRHTREADFLSPQLWCCRTYSLARYGWQPSITL